MGTIISIHRRHFFCLVLLSILLPLLPSLHAQDYYADLTITIDTSGYVDVQGLTDYPNLTVQNTEQYTSKQQSLWTFNLAKQEMFSNFVYTLTLPKESSLNYIKSSGTIRIEENLGALIVRGYGQNESLSILIQYQINKQDESFFVGNIVYIILIPSIIIVSLLLIYFLYKEKKTKPTGVIATAAPPQPEWKGLNHRQKEIMKILQEKNVPLTQTDIQRELQIPKASVSRNIHGLERKGLIEKEQIGMSNLIRLKKL